MDTKQTSLLLLLSASLGTLGVEIFNCTNNKVEIFEDSPVPVTCGGIDNTASVLWRRGNGDLIGECGADGTSCRSELYNDFSLNRSTSSSESQLTLLPEYRRHAGVTVSCRDVGATASTASCTLVIRRHAVLSECNVTTNTVSQTVSGSCLVQGAYSSDNHYSCSWSVNNQKSLGGFDSAREKCSFTHPLPTEGGLYTYTIAVFPPSTAGFSKNITIDPPSSPGTVSVTVTASTSTPDSPHDTRWIIGCAVIAVTFIVILIAVICVVVNRRKLRCQDVTREKPAETKDSDFQETVNVLYYPSQDQGRKLTDTEEHYYSSADVVRVKHKPAAVGNTRQEPAVYD